MITRACHKYTGYDILAKNLNILASKMEAIRRVNGKNRMIPARKSGTIGK
jgi:hypothetical protein